MIPRIRAAFGDGRWALWLVGAVTFVVRLPLLTRPRGYVFDEIFYASDAADLLQWGAETGGFRPHRVVHPPGGKWMIAAGIRLFGFTPTGWRIASVVAGALVAVLVAATVRRLGGAPILAACAGLAICFDGIMFVTSRLALLDIFVALWTSLAVWFLAVAWTVQPDHRRARRALLAATVSVGLATSVKWSGLFLIVVVAAVGAVIDRRLAPPGRARWRSWGTTAWRVTLVPVLVYVAVWLPREVGVSPMTPKQFWDGHVAVARFHRDLEPSNAYAASATTWLAQTEPVALYKQTCTPAMAGSPAGLCPRRARDTEVRILAVASPVVWAAGIVGLAALLVRIAWRRDRVAVLVVAVVATQWLPWVLNPRAAFSFYEATLVPPLVIGAAYALSRGKRRAWTWLGAATVVAAVTMFVYLYPLWTGLPLSHHAAQARLLLGSWP